jgi:hypothetical protein
MKKALLIIAGIVMSPLILTVFAIMGAVTLVSAALAAYAFRT